MRPRACSSPTRYRASPACSRRVGRVRRSLRHGTHCDWSLGSEIHHNMNKHMRLRAAVVLVGLLALTFGVGTAVADAPFGPTITTDQPDYVPGSTVYVTGAGWAIGETVHIVVRSTDLV